MSGVDLFKSTERRQSRTAVFRSGIRLPMGAFWHEFFLRTCWYGGSTYDAWLNIASTKLAARLLTTPNATAQMGLPSAMVLLLLQCALGFWTSCLINILYLKYKRSAPRMESRHSIQLHEIIGSLLGRKWWLLSSVFNVLHLFTVSATQMLACSNLVYFMNDRLDKRAWTLIFGALMSISILTPTAHNFKVWSFFGVVAAVYVSLYLAVGALLDRGQGGVTYTAPQSFVQYYSGVSGYIYFGHDAVPVEIMDAMWKPQEYKLAYFYAILYVLIVAMAPNIIIYRIFGDKVLEHNNALALFSASRWRDTAVVLLLVHQFIVFGIFVLGIYFVWEKLLKVHSSSSYFKRTLSRVPIFLAIYLTALAFPFYGTINRLLDSTIVTWNLYIIPCAAYTAVFWSPSSRCQGDRPFSRLGWAADFSINLGIILWVLIVENGLGLWSSFHVFGDRGAYKIFAKCYSCG